MEPIECSEVGDETQHELGAGRDGDLSGPRPTRTCARNLGGELRTSKTIFSDYRIVLPDRKLSTQDADGMPSVTLRLEGYPAHAIVARDEHLLEADADVGYNVMKRERDVVLAGDDPGDLHRLLAERRTIKRELVTACIVEGRCDLDSDVVFAVLCVEFDIATGVALHGETRHGVKRHAGTARADGVAQTRGKRRGATYDERLRRFLRGRFFDVLLLCLRAE